VCTTYDRMIAEYKLFSFIAIFFFVVVFIQSSFGALTKEDLEEIRAIVREEIEIRMRGIDKQFEQIDKRFEQIDRRFEQIDRRFEQIMNFMWILVVIFVGITSATIGFALWDRRTMVRPFEEKVKEIERSRAMNEDNINRLIQTLREIAKKDVEVADALKKFNLL
jgi:predicted PurR-regulated permease PerM